MRLTLADWLVVALYFLFNIAVGLYYKRRAGTSTAEYFLSGRNVPWWLAGTSMVATTFAADTPLVVTGLVAQNGVAGNWLWWNLLASGMLTVFFYARLWRRSGVMTDIEFAEIRYAGPPAAFLRGFRALYLGLLMNCIILGWVNLAMAKILELVFGISKGEALWIVVGLIVLTSAISTLSGLWGVLVTDLFQFVIKMGMVIVLAVVAVQAVGGIEAMKAKLALIDEARAASGSRGSVLSFVPDVGSAWMPFLTFFVYIGVNWWATWYPGAEPGGVEQPGRQDGDGTRCGGDAPPRLRDAAPHAIDLAGAGLAPELGDDIGDPGEAVRLEEVPAAEAAAGGVHRGPGTRQPEGVEVLELFVAERVVHLCDVDLARRIGDAGLGVGALRRSPGILRLPPRPRRERG